MWLDDRLGVRLPIVQAPMAGAQGATLAVAVSEAGGLGALPCALLTPEAMRRELLVIRAGPARPYNVNFFCSRNRDFSGTPRRGCRPGCTPHSSHQPVQRPARERHRQSPDARPRSVECRCAGVSMGRVGPGAPACEGRGSGEWRFFAPLGRTERHGMPGGPGRHVDARAC